MLLRGSFVVALFLDIVSRGLVLPWGVDSYDALLNLGGSEQVSCSYCSIEPSAMLPLKESKPSSISSLSFSMVLLLSFSSVIVS